MIIVHNDFDLFEKQLILLDDIRNDFYIHIDKKVKDFPYDKFLHLTKFSEVHFVESVDVRWGDFSMVVCELTLLKAAIKGNYRYYHLLSGVDMPLKSNDEIHNFFSEHNGLEFVHFCPDHFAESFRGRIDYYYMMRWMKSVKTGIIRFPAKTVAYLFLYVQRAFGIRRHSNKDIVFGFGSQWFSITSDLAKYILSNEDWIEQHFRFTCCSDEHFLQTLVLNSSFSESLFWKERNSDCMANMRYIDWKRGNPYVFRLEDQQLLIDSPYLFARKFNTKTDNQIINILFEYVHNKNEKTTS